MRLTFSWRSALCTLLLGAVLLLPSPRTAEGYVYKVKSGGTGDGSSWEKALGEKGLLEKLATAGYGTALGVIRAARKQGKKLHVYVDETRPVLQGARLTAWELKKEKIPYTLITDNMAGFLMQQKKIDKIIVGADRIAANGDTANKIGTYSLAVLAQAHGVPLYIAAPLSTIDVSLKTGDSIPIEERKSDEVAHLQGTRSAPRGTIVYNPAFDITPARLITAMITEKGILRKPFRASIARLYKGERGS